MIISERESENPPNVDRADGDLFEASRSLISPVGDFRGITRQKLNEIARQHGIDLATAWWCDQIRRCEEQRDFIRAVESRDHPVSEERPNIVLVPGAFYGQHRHTGADGDQIIQIAGALGWPCERVAIQSFGRLEVNAARILDHLLQTKAKRVMLVSLSKGSADVAAAMMDRRADRAMSSVCGWVSISGMVTGTPLVQWLRSHRLRTLGVHLLLWCRAQRFAVVDQLCSENGPLAGPLRIPAHLRAFHVVGCPLRRHLRHPWSARGYERIAPLGPTDGGGILLADLARLPGSIYPAWGADHYFQPDWDVRPLIRNVLLHAAQSDAHARATPATRSTA